MFNHNNWEFSDLSGGKHTFTLSLKSKKLPSEPGVIILAYTHPRGHRAGWQVNVLHVAGCDNLQTCVKNPQALKAAQDSTWNSSYYLIESNEQKRNALAIDLAKVYEARR